MRVTTIRRNQETIRRSGRRQADSSSALKNVKRKELGCGSGVHHKEGKRERREGKLGFVHHVEEKEVR